jgi:hypothetical protein
MRTTTHDSAPGAAAAHRDAGPDPLPPRPVGLGEALGFLGVVIFAAVVLAQHALAPELSPVDHTVSEYANTPTGWLMVVGFSAWGISLAATAILAVTDPSAHRTSSSQKLMAALLAIAAMGLLVTAAFKTQTSAGVLPAGVPRTTEGRLHDLGSGAALLALFGAALTSIRLIEDPRWFKRPAMGLLCVALATHVGLLIGGDPAPGLRQRLLLAGAVAWHVVLLVALHSRLVAIASDKAADATDTLRSMSR